MVSIPENHLPYATGYQKQSFGYQQHIPFTARLNQSRQLPVPPPSSVGNRRPIVKSNGQFTQPKTLSGAWTTPFQPQQNVYHTSVPFQEYFLFGSNAPTSSGNNIVYPQDSAVHGLSQLLPERQQLAVSPPPGFAKHPEPGITSKSSGKCPESTPTSLFGKIDLVSDLNDLHVSPVPSPPLSTPWSTETTDSNDNSDSDDDSTPSHPNKFPVEIEYHDNQFCSYKRQATKSGEKVKQKVVNSYDPVTLEPQTSIQQSKYYQKHLVRICRCGKYQAMDGALQQGRANDCNGYEIHYSQKCRWKAYDDFKTGKRVLIRLCKCYKPA